MRRLVVLLFALLPAAAVAQEGRIAFSRSVRYDFEVPERWGDRVPSQRVSEMILFFNASESVMMSAPDAAEEGSSGASRRAAGMAARLRMTSASRSDHERLRHSYVSFEDGSSVEVREFMGRDFLISGQRPGYAWRLGTEQREFLGYVVQKATAEHDGSYIEAWFTMQIPVPGGPGEFGGLPGMILLVSVDDGHTVYAATDVDLSGLGGVTIAMPEGGDAVSREEYDRIVAEKLEEVRMLSANRNGRPPF